ncbi:MAG: cardiolipin synthase [Gemmatimonadota bacterium]
MMGALATVGALAIVLWIYGMVAPDFVDVAPDRLSSGDGDHGPAEALAAHLDVPLLDGNRVELLVNGVQVFPAMLAAIEDADQSINLLSYIYWEGGIAGQVADGLSAAARRGVKVRVVLDAVGANSMDPDLVEQMRGAGAEVAWFNPVRWFSLRRFNHRTHRKVMVVDGRIGFTGGIGIASEWTGDAEDSEHWRDDHFRFEGPVVRYLQGAFVENWRQATGEVLSGTHVFPDIEPAGEARMAVINSGPAGATSEIGLTYWLMFRGARERIYVATPYFVPDPDLEIGLHDAARRGLDVRLLVPNHHQDSRLVRYASQTWYADLLEAGVRIYEYQPTMMHVKAVSVDREWAIVGSANFDNRSFMINFEVSVAVFDAGFVAELDDSFERDLRKAREITLEEVDAWPLLARARNRLARALREQL